ncbi:tRNA-splicing endonuclease subunit Sen54-like [Asterias amurensis]|uniref:tRNA-splicing endonuclease subunit Sen54-like n=1 Tax=Asterias amurensis TaxID=7602 RepID=UPI003AB56A7B
MADVLSAEELLSYRHINTWLPRRAHKENRLRVTDLEKLKRVYQQQDGLLQEKRVTKLGNLAVGEWNTCKELVEVKVEKGKFWQTMGYHSGGKKYVYAEEGLFLLEMNCMELMHHGVPLTQQEAYELMIPEHFSLEHYQVYCHLMRLGYITTRHRENDITDYEYRIRLHQYRHNQKKVYRKVQGWFQQMGDDNETDIKSGEMGRYGDTSSNTSLPDGQQTSNDTSSISFAGVSSRASNDQAVTGDPMTCRSNPLLPGSETSSIVNNLPLSGDESSLYSDSPVLVQPVKPEPLVYGASVNLLNYHKRFMQSNEKDMNPLKRSLETSTSGTESETDGDSLLRRPTKRVKLEIEKDLVIFSDSVKDGSLDSAKVINRPPSSEDSPTKCDFSSLKRINYQVEKENFDKLIKPASAHWESSDLGTSYPSGTSVNIDDVLDTFLPSLIDNADNDPISSPYSSWNFQTIKLPNFADKPIEHGNPWKRSRSRASRRHDQCSTENEKAEQLIKTSQNLLNTSANMIATSGEMLKDCSSKGKTGCNAGDKGNNTHLNKGRAPTNWSEYKKMLSMEEAARRADQDIFDSPVDHLWRGDVKPLVRPGDATYTGNILNKLQVISSSYMTSEHTRLSPTQGSNNVKLAFDVFHPSPTFKKTQPGRPKFHVVVAKVSDPVPDLLTLARLLQQASSITLLVAVVDNGDITFYTLKGIELTTDIILG